MISSSLTGHKSHVRIIYVMQKVLELLNDLIFCMAQYKSLRLGTSGIHTNLQSDLGIEWNGLFPR